MKWSPKNNFEYLCTGSSTNKNFSELIGSNVVQTIGIFDILKCGGGGATEMDLQFFSVLIASFYRFMLFINSIKPEDRGLRNISFINQH